jgi:Ni/Co efflux regulator RcnB
MRILALETDGARVLGGLSLARMVVCRGRAFGGLALKAGVRIDLPGWKRIMSAAPRAPRGARIRQALSKALEPIMNRNVIFSAVIAISLTMSGFAFAEGMGDQNNRGRDENAQQNERGAGPNQAYHRGDRLPAAEHSKQYEVNDWRTRNLREPPEGHHWVRSGNDYVLAAIATGVIADIVLNH